MTTIGSTNPYYSSSLLNISGNRNNGKGGSEGGETASLPRQPTSAGLTGSDTVFGARLADALWSMESQGVEIDQPADDTWLGKPPNTSVQDEFLDMAKKTFAERIRDQYLEAHGLSEADLAAMSPEEREAVEAEIRKAILEAMGINGDKQDAAMDMGGDPQKTDTAALAAGAAPAGNTRSKTDRDELG